jgi:large subunit ribosomal protein L36e
MSTTQTQKAPILPKNKTGLAVGWGRGFRITKRPLKERFRDVRKRKPGPRKLLVREVIREVTGYAPYEKRILELLRNGLDKKALRLAKRRIGTHHRAKRKREEMAGVLRQEARKKKETEQQQP